MEEAAGEADDPVDAGPPLFSMKSASKAVTARVLVLGDCWSLPAFLEEMAHETDIAATVVHAQSFGTVRLGLKDLAQALESL